MGKDKGGRTIFPHRYHIVWESKYRFKVLQGEVRLRCCLPQGREALQALVADLSQAVYYEPGLVVAEGDLVAIHGRIRGWADEPQVVIDPFRVEGGKLAEHWDVLQNEVPVTAALGGMSMFDPEAHRTQPGTA